jgi:hypothetical protein
MAGISYDGHAFSIDGRRIWLASGVLHYSRTPQPLWRDRLRAAKQAGLNCIDVPVCWAVHEPQAAHFNFKGAADLRKFIALIAEQGLYCILRPGPYIGDGYDMGGLPPWLLAYKEPEPPAGMDRDLIGEPQPMRLRQACPPFMQSAARYFDAVLAQVREQQVTAAKPGPILAVQVEHRWLASNEGQSEKYLQQLARFLRESGCNVPLLSRNNLWQTMPGVIETWQGDDHPFACARQLRSLQPAAPAILHIEASERADTWGSDAQAGKAPQELLRSLAGVSAAGAMFNIVPFAASTALHSAAGRLAGGEARFLTTAMDAQSPLSESGGRGESYALVKRFATFLTQFQPVMANLKAAEHHAVAAAPVGVVQQTGAQGSFVSIFRANDSAPREVEVVTPDGQSLLIDMGDDAVAWTLLKANLDGVATLDLTNLRPWAFVDKRLLVLFGPAGSQGLISIDGTVLGPRVPAAGTLQPSVTLHDDLAIVVLSSEQLDAAYLAPTGLHIGVAGLDGADQPIAHGDHAASIHVGFDGKVTQTKRPRAGKPRAPQLQTWSAAPAVFAHASAPRYATLPGPSSLEACGVDRGYGWYRIKVRRAKATRANLFIPCGGDRLHLFQEGKPRALIGVGPGAKSGPVGVNIPAGESDLVFLADNLGRFAEDLAIDQSRGVCSDLFDVKEVAVPKPQMHFEPRIDPFAVSGYVPGCTTDEHGPFARFVFTLKISAAKKPLVLRLHGPRPRSVILVNNQPLAIDPGHGVPATFLLDTRLRKGANRVTLALIDPRPGERYDPRKNMTLYQTLENLTEGATWWYARWQLPDAAAYQPLNKAAGPTFFRTTFTAPAGAPPLHLDIAGGTKGQLYLNGHDLGRYFVATPDGKRIPPQSRHYLPECWFHADGPNELVLFDEHGKAPTKSKLLFE